MNYFLQLPSPQLTGCHTHNFHDKSYDSLSGNTALKSTSILLCNLWIWLDLQGDDFIMTDYLITDHAYFEMQRRDISEQIVRNVLEKPDQIEEVRSGRRVYQSKIEFRDSNRTYLIRVFVDIGREPWEIVTVYRTSKIEKYWRK